MNYLLILLGISLIIFIYKQSSDILSPAFILIFIWYIPFILSFFKLSSLQSDAYSSLGLIIICSVTLIMSGAFLFGILWRKQSVPIKEWSRKLTQNIGIIDWNKTTIMLFLVLAMGLIVALTYWVEFLNIGFPLLGIDRSIISQVGGSIHRYGKDSPLQIILSLDYMIGGIAFLAFLMAKRFKIMYAACFLCPILMGILKLSNSDIINAAVTYIIIGYYVGMGRGMSIKKASFRLIVLIHVIVISFAMFCNLRLMRTLNEYAPKYSEMLGFSIDTGIDWLDEGMAFYYGYTSLSFINFDRSLQVLPVYKLGLSMFRPFYTVTLRGDEIDEAKARIFTNYISSSVSMVGTFMRDLYFEGGILLIYIGALYYTIIIALAYNMLVRKANIYYLFIYSSLAYPFIWIVFQNAFANIDIYTSPIIVIIIIKIFILISAKVQSVNNIPLYSSKASISG